MKLYRQSPFKIADMSLVSEKSFTTKRTIFLQFWIILIAYTLFTRTSFAADYKLDFSDQNISKIIYAFNPSTNEQRYGIRMIGYRDRKVLHTLDTLFSGYDPMPVCSALSRNDSMYSECTLPNEVAQIYLIDVKRLNAIMWGDSICSIDLNIKASFCNTSKDSFSLYMAIPVAGHLFYHKTVKQDIYIDTVIKDIAAPRWLATNSMCDSEFVIIIYAQDLSIKETDTLSMKTDYLEIIFHTNGSTTTKSPLSNRNNSMQAITARRSVSNGGIYSIYSKSKQKINFYSLAGVKIGGVHTDGINPVYWNSPASGAYLMKSGKSNLVTGKLVVE